MIRPIQNAGILSLLLACVACSHTPVRDATPTPAAANETPVRLLVLAGQWEYEDSGIVQTLRLDEQGNGTYGWKGGRFQTADLTGQLWSGYWSQRENDREGRFQVTFSENFLEGRGQWWYTRIENDVAPHRPGGSFIIRRGLADNESESSTH